MVTGKFKEIEFQYARNDGNVIFLENFMRHCFPGVDGVTKLMGRCKWDIYKPDATTSFVAFKVGIIC